MNLSDFVTFSSTGSMNMATWQFINIISVHYFKHNTRYIFLGSELPPTELMLGSAYYVLTRDETSNHSFYEADLIMVDRTMMKTTLLDRVVGNTVVVVSSIEEARTINKMHPHLRAIYLLPKNNSCDVLTWSKQLYDILLIETWAEGSPDSQLDMFPPKLPKSLKGYPINVAYQACSALLSVENEKYTGPIYFLIESILSKLNLAVTELNITDVAEMDADGSLRGFLKVLNNGEADLAVGCYQTTSNRVFYSEVLPLFNEVPFVYSVPAPRQLSMASSVYAGFSGFIWLLVTIFLLMFAALIFIYNKNHFDWSTCMLQSVRGILNQPLNVIYQDTYMNIFCIVFQVVCLHIIWFYQSTLLIYLFTRPREKPIKTVDEAIEAGLIFYVRSIFKFLVESTPYWEKIKNPKRHRLVEEFDYRLVTDKKTAIHAGPILADKIAYAEMVGSTYKKNIVHFLNDNLINRPTHFFMTKNHPLIEIMSYKMLQMFESGLFTFWSDAINARAEKEAAKVGRQRINDDDADVPDDDHQEGNKPLKFENLQTCFYILISLNCFAIIIFVCEFCYVRYKRWRGHFTK